MRRADRVSTCLLTGLLATVSCAVVPGGSEGRDAARRAAAERWASARSLAAETAAVAATLRLWDTSMEAATLDQLAGVIAREARAAGLPPALVLAVIEVESSGRSFAVSHVGAVGLMQLLPSTGAFVAEYADLPWQGRDTLFDPVSNVRLGIRYLDHLLRRYSDLPTALAAYNWGPGRIAERLAQGEPLPRDYVDRVLAAWSQAGREI